MGLRDTLRKAAGLLVELPPEETPPATQPTATPSARGGAGGGNPAAELDNLLAELEGGPKRARTVEEIVRETEGPNLDQISVPSNAQPPVVGPDGKPDFAGIYAAAGLPAAGFGAEQMLELLASLPAELPLETKRQTMRVTLTALGKSAGATPETLVADASRKLAALAAYSDTVEKDTQSFVAAAEQEIAALQQQIEAKRQAMQEARLKQSQVSLSCDAESDRLDDVLEFFSLDVGPSKYAGEPRKV